uniref:Glycosyltransferase 61 catalytic domain-containing protein n=1 Tax=Ananas comosus var. bracteatus TaxID=296719 RepID=A0A6V7PFE5_ANACO|nr:unnamed protein product [Ananas comosus var. bracteatus]
MVHHHRNYHVQPHRKEDLEEQQQQQQQKQKHQIQDPSVEQAHRLRHLMDYAYFVGHHRSRVSNTAFLRLLFLFSLISCTLLFAPRVFFYTFGADDVEFRMRPREDDQSWAAPCSTVRNDSICCDRTAFRTDVCFMRGDVRTHAASNSIFLLSPSSSPSNSTVDEKIRPYTRKWEASVMSTIDELSLRTVAAANRCDVVHRVPAVVFSTGGYTGNVYHEFNDGLIPLYITSQHFDRQVVFVMLEYHDWWMTKHGHVVSRLSDYPPIDFSGDRRTHCFPEAIVGLRIHDELSIDAAKMKSNKSISDFRRLLDEAYAPRVRAIDRDEQSHRNDSNSSSSSSNNRSNEKAPKMVIMSRNGSRAIENEREVVEAAEAVGFEVEVMSPQRDTELARIYRALNSCDVMVGVHGAAMTHFLFMRPRSVFVQVVPLGTDWAAEMYYGEPARKLGLRYAAYKILPRESSLYRKYSRNATILKDPDSVNAQGWQVTKKVYLDGQNVRLDIGRFRKRLVKAFEYVTKKRRRQQLQQLQQLQPRQQRRIER